MLESRLPNARRRRFRSAALCGLAVCVVVGCKSGRIKFPEHAQLKHYQMVAREYRTPPQTVGIPCEEMGFEYSAAPYHLGRSSADVDYWDMSLAEAIEITLQNARILRSLNAQVLSSPSSAATIYDPAIAETNPQFGPEAALSAFDATWRTSIGETKTDRPLNSQFFGAPNTQTQDAVAFQTQLQKFVASGAQLSLSNTTTYTDDHLRRAFLPTSYFMITEARITQPLLQGAGVDINRIAGPNGQPGFFGSNGIVLARLNSDTAVADFEANVVSQLSSLEDAYWQLAYAYRNLDAQIAARDAALQTYRSVRERYDANFTGGSADALAQAERNYLQFQGTVQDALAGTATGTGVYTAERTLRRVMGLPAADGRLIRPSDGPVSARMNYDWDELLTGALVSRVEIRRQKIQVRRREMELVAARNFLLPRLDLVGAYRFIGLGDDLVGPGSAASIPLRSAVNNMFQGEFQEFDASLQLNVPLGYRRASANIRQTHLNLTRERLVLKEQQRLVAIELADAIAELNRAYVQMQTRNQARIAAIRQVEFVRLAYEAGRENINTLVQSQQAQAQAESDFYRAAIDHTLAIKNVQQARGALPEYNNVFLLEGRWPAQAYSDAAWFGRQERRMNFLLPWRTRVTNPHGRPMTPPLQVEQSPGLYPAPPENVESLPAESNPTEVETLPPIDGESEGDGAAASPSVPQPAAPAPVSLPLTEPRFTAPAFDAPPAAPPQPLESDESLARRASPGLPFRRTLR